MTVDLGVTALGDASYVFPRDLRRRKLIGYIVVPLLFYAPLLVGLATTRDGGDIDSGLLLMLAMFLSIFVGLFLVIIHGQRPWVESDGLMMRVEGSEFQIKHLAAISLFTKGRAGLEPTHYLVVFDVVVPGVSVNRFETHPIRSVKDADALVKDLQRLLPDVPYYDRTPLAEAVAAHDRINAAQRKIED